MYHEIYNIKNIFEAIPAAENYLNTVFGESDVVTMLDRKDVQLYDDNGNVLAWIWYDEEHQTVLIEM